MSAQNATVGWTIAYDDPLRKFILIEHREVVTAEFDTMEDAEAFRDHMVRSGRNPSS